mmetsp:Transcript_404/g.942  ORF Transcript_404/g.942 Transcript_404/m.942 type:complete len:257 (-) Transcript_404:650-1420(-)
MINLRLLALHALATVAIVLILGVVGVTVGGGCRDLSDLISRGGHHGDLLNHLTFRHGLVLAAGGRESGLECGDLGCAERVREVNTENNKEPALGEWAFVHRHTSVHDGLDHVGLDDFTGLCLDNQSATIRMLLGELKTAESLLQGDLLLHEQVGTLAPEHSVFLLVDHKHDISGKLTGSLIGLTLKDNLLVVAHTLLDVHLEHLLLLDNLDALLVALTRTLTARAANLHALDHARSNLGGLQDHTTSITGATLSHS